MQTGKPRYELTNARLLKGWDEAEVARRMSPSPRAKGVRGGKAGIKTPRADMIGELCRIFKVAHPKELNLDAQFNTSTTQCREDEILPMLAHYDRRQLLELFSK